MVTLSIWFHTAAVLTELKWVIYVIALFVHGYAATAVQCAARDLAMLGQALLCLRILTNFVRHTGAAGIVQLCGTC